MAFTRFWVGIVLCGLLGIDARAQSSEQTSTDPTTSGSNQSTSGAPGRSGKTQADASDIQAETGNRDITYIRTRAVFQYDYKDQVNDVTTNRLRLKLQYGFGEGQKFAVSVMTPVLWKSNATQSGFGVGDMEITAGMIFYDNNKFRTGISAQVVPPTSSENLLGGATLDMKGTWGFAYVLSPRFEFTGMFNYKQSVAVYRGQPTKQFEPDVSLNMRVKKMTWFLESDSYYNFIPQQFAPMLKFGISKEIGKSKAWVASVYVEGPLSGYARQAQEIVNTGVDVTWFPWPKR